MDCPKCPGKLEEKYVEGAQVDCCHVCEGIWFDLGELEKVLKNDAVSFNFVDLNKEGFDGTEIKTLLTQTDSMTGKCPKCAVELKKEKYKSDVTIDVCPKCYGIWLDGGEIQKLRNRFLAKINDKIQYCRDFLTDKFSQGQAKRNNKNQK